MNSGAPRKYLPSGNVILPYLFADEKASIWDGLRLPAPTPVILSMAARSASMVALLSVEA